MRIEPMGDRAWILRDCGPWEPYDLATALEEAGISGLVEAWPSYEAVAIAVGSSFDLANLESVLPTLEAPTLIERQLHTIPVCYECGEDLEAVADALGLKTHQVVDLHSGSTYRCSAIGFCPGFPFLRTLPQELCGVPRRASPRPRVPIGSVGITGNQTGIYSMERPGGWALIGRTPLTIVSVKDNYFPIQPGDQVRFEPISRSIYDSLQGSRL